LPEDAQPLPQTATAGEASQPGDMAGSVGLPSPAAIAATARLPLYGRIAAGLPIEALANPSTFTEVPAGLVGRGEHYALEIAGDSMVEAGILDGDTVIIRQTETAENGAIVVALIDEAEATLKRFRQRGREVALEPANAAYETRVLEAERVRIQGRLVGLIRSYV